MPIDRRSLLRLAALAPFLGAVPRPARAAAEAAGEQADAALRSGEAASEKADYTLRIDARGRRCSSPRCACLPSSGAS